MPDEVGNGIRALGKCSGSGVAGLLWFLLAVAATGCAPGGDTADAPSRASQQASRDSVLEVTSARLQARHGAIEAWSDDLPRSDLLTLDLQRRWVDPGRPIITGAELLDLAWEPAGYVAVFRSSYRSTYLRLSVSDDLASYLLDNRADSYLDERLIVATISEIRRPLLTIDFVDDDPPFLELLKSDYFVAYGVMHDVELVSF